MHCLQNVFIITAKDEVETSLLTQQTQIYEKFASQDSLQGAQYFRFEQIYQFFHFKHMTPFFCVMTSLIIL